MILLCFSSKISQNLMKENYLFNPSDQVNICLMYMTLF